jgi:hypothetical protein
MVNARVVYRMNTVLTGNLNGVPFRADLLLSRTLAHNRPCSCSSITIIADLNPHFGTRLLRLLGSSCELIPHINEHH